MNWQRKLWAQRKSDDNGRQTRTQWKIRRKRHEFVKLNEIKIVCSRKKSFIENSKLRINYDNQMHRFCVFCVRSVARQKREKKTPIGSILIKIRNIDCLLLDSEGKFRVTYILSLTPINFFTNLHFLSPSLSLNWFKKRL